MNHKIVEQLFMQKQQTSPQKQNKTTNKEEATNKNHTTIVNCVKNKTHHGLTVFKKNYIARTWNSRIFNQAETKPLEINTISYVTQTVARTGLTVIVDYPCGSRMVFQLPVWLKQNFILANVCHQITTSTRCLLQRFPFGYIVETCQITWASEKLS